jgi:hypothetical protein
MLLDRTGKRGMPNVIPLRPDEPRRVGRYRLTGRIGDLAAPHGSPGRYVAKRGDGATVTITLLGEDRAADAAGRDRFTAEARVARRVPPFCAARILDAGFEGGRPYLVTEFVPGPTLAEAVLTGGPLPEDDVRGVAAGAATGLAAIHQAGLVHGSLGPDALVLSPDGPRVVDFSITPPYGLATPAADMLAWAYTVLYAAAGPPHPRPAHRHGEPGGAGEISLAPVPRYGQRELIAVPPDVRGLVEGCLSPDPASRPSARAVLAELLSHRGGSAGLLAEGSRLAQAAARPAAAIPHLPARPRRSGPAPLLWAGACVLCLLAIAAAALFLTRKPTAAGRPAPATGGRGTSPVRIPATISGIWSGTVHQTHPSLSVTVRIFLGSESGNVAYPALDCTGNLAVVSASPRKLLVRQTISTGRSNCEDGLITLVPQGGAKLAFTFSRPGGASPTGILTRVH